MKKLLLLLAVVIAVLTSCNDDQLIDIDANSDNQILFSTTGMSTRATNIDNDNIGSADGANGFSVYGYTQDATDTYCIFDDEHIKDKGGWCYDNTQYWQSGNTYHFHAIAPYCSSTDERNWSFQVNSTDKSKGAIHFVNIKTDGTASGEQDLVYSYQTATGKSTGNSKVDFTFQHLLSRVKFRFAGVSGNENYGDIRVKDITITDAYSEGDIEIINDKSISSETIEDSPWTVSANDRTSLSFGGGASTFTTGQTDSKDKFLIPNVLDAVVYHVTITFEYNNNEIVKEVALPEITMVKGCSYIYVINVKSNADGLTIPDIEPIITIGEITNKWDVELFDYAMSDGSFVSHNVESLTAEQQAACVGIVYWLDPDRPKYYKESTETISKAKASRADDAKTTYASLKTDKVLAQDYPDCRYGLIVSLKNLVYEGSTSISWQGFLNDEKETGECEDVYLNYQAKSEIYSAEPYEPIEIFLPAATGDNTNVYILADYDATSRAQVIGGYNNTKVLKAYNFQAKYIVHPIVALSALSNVNNFSSWFIPAIKELTLLAGNDVQNVMQCFSNALGYEVAVGVDNSLAKLSTDYYDTCMGNQFCSSTEMNSPNRLDDSDSNYPSRQMTLILYKYNGGYLSILNVVAKNAPLSVRAVCAF
jgi:hypothetical protein